MPLELARPCGNLALADFSSSRGVSAPFAQTTTPRAFWKCSRLSSSKYATPVVRPAALVSMRVT